VAEFAAAAKTFIGLYEPMQMIRAGTLTHTQGVFADCGDRIENLDDAPALRRYWRDASAGLNGDGAEAVKVADDFLTLAGDAGVSRSTATEVTVDRDVFRHYVADDGPRLEPGTVAKVEAPYWSQGDVVLEKGRIGRTAEDQGVVR